MPTSDKKKVAIVHDWMNGLRGGESVLDAVVELYPNAEIFTLFYTPGTLNSRIESRPIHASFLNRIPGARKRYRYLLPLFPMAIERFDLRKFDLVISTSHCVAKGVIAAPTALHVCYCFTPMRYAWDGYRNYFSKNWLEPILYPFLHYLRIWDVTSSARVDYFVTLSHYVAQRIKTYYRRDPEVIYPFVDLKQYQPGAGDRGDYYLVAGAMAPYKRVDLAIQACEALGRKLLIVGTGQEERSLKAMAGKHTQFLGRVSNQELADLYQGAKALIFPGEEDFGIVPLEAMASGTPVIAYGRGGAMETIKHQKTGWLFEEQTVASLSDAILNVEAKHFDVSDCRKQAEKFSRDRFMQTFKALIDLRVEHQGKSLSPSTLVQDLVP